MNFPMTGTAALVLAVVFGFVFGWLLQKGRVTVYDVIVNQFRLRDFTVLKVMLTAIVVGGIGVLALKQMGYATYHIKSADLLAVIAGAGLFGVGMVLLGYCPGTGVAAIATGSLHALVGFLGMIAGGVIYALTFPWVRDHVLPVASLGKVRLTDLTGIGDWPWFAILAVVAVLVFWIIERRPGRDVRATPQA